MEQDRRWLAEHRHEYPGYWLAVKGDRLIVADPQLGRAYQVLRETPDTERAIIY